MLQLFLKQPCHRDFWCLNNSPALSASPRLLPAHFPSLSAWTLSAVRSALLVAPCPDRSRLCCRRWHFLFLSFSISCLRPSVSSDGQVEFSFLACLAADCLKQVCSGRFSASLAQIMSAALGRLWVIRWIQMRQWWWTPWNPTCLDFLFIH